MVALFMALGLWAAAPLQVNDGTGAALVSNAVTIEGTASLEVAADTCKLFFDVAGRGKTALGAAADLKESAAVLQSAIRNISGTNARFEIGQVTLARFTDGGQDSFRARRQVVVSVTAFPKDEDGARNYVTKVAAVAVESGAVPEDVEAPAVLFQITRPAVLEERLATRAVEDAKARAALAAKLLASNLRYVRSAYFPSGVTAEGRFVPFSKDPVPITSDRVTVIITYTVQVAFALER